MDPTNGKKTEVVSILSTVCAQNSPLDLRVVGDKSMTRYPSRFLSLDEGRKKSVLIIEAPTSKGNVVPLRPGQEARVSFSHNGQKRSFISQVLGRGKFRLSSEISVPSLEFLLPEDIAPREKRGFYRVLMGKTRPIEVRLGILAKQEEGTRRIRSREKGVITDLGGGGLGFRISEGKSLLLDLGTRVELSFRLPPDDVESRLLGRICFSLRRPELREVFLGVQFVDLDSDMEYKRAADRVLRYVAEQQRRNLSNRARISS